MLCHEKENISPCDVEIGTPNHRSDSIQSTDYIATPI